jgi:hypothetical protein
MGLYYEEELNLKEIGAVLGVSESRVSQLHTQAVARLRASLGSSVDFASLIGLRWRWPAVGRPYLDGGKFASLVQPAAFAIVVVGTFGAVLLQTEAPTFMRGVRMLRWVFRRRRKPRQPLAREIALWSHTARRDGLLSLEQYMGNQATPSSRRACAWWSTASIPTSCAACSKPKSRPTNSPSARRPASGNRRPAMRRRSASWAPCWA